MKSNPNPKKKFKSPKERLRFLKDRVNTKRANGDSKAASQLFSNLELTNISIKLSDELGVIGGDCMALCSSENNKPLTGWISEAQANAVAAQHEHDRPGHTTIINRKHGI